MLFVCRPLDVLGPYEVLGRLPNTDVVFVAETPGLVRNDIKSLSIDVAATLDDMPSPDVVLIGGGPGQSALMSDGKLHERLRTADRTGTWTASVCTGTLILAAAGVLDGRQATTHWAAVEQLAGFGATPSKQRVFVDGHYATAAGVSAGIDMPLDHTAQTIMPSSRTCGAGTTSSGSTCHAGFVSRGAARPIKPALVPVGPTRRNSKCGCPSPMRNWAYTNG